MSSLRNAIQSLRSQRDNTEVIVTENNGEIDNFMTNVSFEDINFSDDEEDCDSLRLSNRFDPPQATPPSKAARSTDNNSSQHHQTLLVLTTPTPPPTITPKPVSTPIITTSSRQRFPGPAGCLPKLVTKGQPISNSIQSASAVVPSPARPSPLTTPRRNRLAVKSSPEIASHSKTKQDDFSNLPSWTAMMKDLEDISDSPYQHLLKFTIAHVKRLANNQKLSDGKIPFLRVVVKSVSNNVKNISTLVKDQTGEMLATVHMKVWNEYKEEWGSGCCMILRQVTVLSPTPRKHYLNITMDNIVRLYPAGTTPHSLRPVTMKSLRLPINPAPGSSSSSSHSVGSGSGSSTSSTGGSQQRTRESPTQPRSLISKVSNAGVTPSSLTKSQPMNNIISTGPLSNIRPSHGPSTLHTNPSGVSTRPSAVSTGPFTRTSTVSTGPFTRTSTLSIGPSTMCTRPSTSCTRPSTSAGPSSGPSTLPLVSSQLPGTVFSKYCPTDDCIDDDFDAFFDDIDVSALDV